MLVLVALLGLFKVVSATLPVSHAADLPQLPERGSQGATQDESLRILPIGASITYGFHSTDGNGYREKLRDLLSPTQVIFIGSQCSGNTSNEGHPGFMISEVERFANADFAYKPNVVLVYVGTNDMERSSDLPNAPARMSALIEYLASHIPGSLVIVGNLFVNTKPNVQSRINAFNEALPQVLSELQSKDTNVLMADMANALTLKDLYQDGIHPNDSGYEMMAQVFQKVLENAQRAGKIPTAAQNVPKQPLCHSVPPALANAAGGGNESPISHAAGTDPSNSIQTVLISTVVSAGTTSSSSPIAPSKTLSSSRRLPTTAKAYLAASTPTLSFSTAPSSSPEAPHPSTTSQPAAGDAMHTSAASRASIWVQLLAYTLVIATMLTAL